MKKITTVLLSLLIASNLFSNERETKFEIYKSYLNKYGSEDSRTIKAYEELRDYAEKKEVLEETNQTEELKIENSINLLEELKKDVIKTDFKDAKSRYLLAIQYLEVAGFEKDKTKKEEYLKMAKYHLDGGKTLTENSEDFNENAIFAEKCRLYLEKNSSTFEKESEIKNRDKVIMCDNNFVFPTNKGRISSKYGYRIHPVHKTKKLHKGIDVAIPTGSELFSITDGIVEFAGWQSGYGNVVIVRHSNGLKSVYAHNKKLLVKKNQKVSAGEVVALANSTGVSTGSHLHFEIRKDNKAVDPLSVLKNFKL